MTDFKNPRELADFLLYLNASDEEYLRYFDWKKQGLSERFRIRSAVSFPELLAEIGCFLEAPTQAQVRSLRLLWQRVPPLQICRLRPQELPARTAPVPRATEGPLYFSAIRRYTEYVSRLTGWQLITKDTYALRFNGQDDYMTVPSHPRLRFNSDFTLMVRFVAPHHSIRNTLSSP